MRGLRRGRVRRRAAAHLLAEKVLQATLHEIPPHFARPLAVVLDEVLNVGERVLVARAAKDRLLDRLKAHFRGVLLEVVIELAVVEHRVALAHLDEVLEREALPVRQKNWPLLWGRRQWERMRAERQPRSSAAASLVRGSALLNTPRCFSGLMTSSSIKLSLSIAIDGQRSLPSTLLSSSSTCSSESRQNEFSRLGRRAAPARSQRGPR